MKKSLRAIILIAFIFLSFSKTKAQDGIFSDAQTLSNNTFSLGIQPVIYSQLNNDEFMLILRGAYGLQPGLSLHGKVGVLREQTYVGGHLEYLLAGEPSDPLSFSLLGGVYAFDDVGLKFGGVLSKQIGTFSLYSGLSFEPLFTEPDELTPLLLPIGIDIPLAGEQVNFVFEADIALNNDAELYEALHFGANFYF